MGRLGRQRRRQVHELAREVLVHKKKLHENKPPNSFLKAFMFGESTAMRSRDGTDAGGME